MGLGADYAEYRRYEEVDLSALNYNLPTFFALIEENSGPDAANWRGKDSKNISRIFLQQVRSLLICKTN